MANPYAPERPRKLPRRSGSRRAKEETRQAAPPPLNLSLALRACGLLALGFGIPLWVIGAHLTLRGWKLAIDLALGFIGLLPATAAPALPDPGTMLIGAISIGGVYSIVEVSLRPRGGVVRQLRRAFGLGTVLVVLVVWLATILTDLGSTYLAASTPPPDAWPLTRWIAANPVAAAVWAAFLTFIPEQLIIEGLRLLRGKPRGA